MGRRKLFTRYKLNSSMPRPRKNPDEVLIRELRITPPSGNEIEDWCLDDSVIKFVAFKEGGNETGKKLHYHAYIETTMTSQALTKWIYTIAGCIESGERGNAVFFTRAIHDKTFGYISKQKECVVRKSYEQRHLDEWFKESDGYNRQRGTTRKREQRTRQQELANVIEQVASDLKTGACSRSVNDVVHAILKYCKHEDIRFPTRTQMESYVVELLYPYDQSLIVEYYMRSFPRIF